MDHDALLAHIEAALRSITHPRFYETERGFQGELLAALRLTIPDHLLPHGAVVEQEYQKRLQQHGLTIRPDIIIHEPFDPTRHRTRRDGNVAVIELKLNASRGAAQRDFVSLLKMMEALSYPAGVFINIASDATHADAAGEAAGGLITCFATAPVEGGVHVVRQTA